LKLRRHSAWWAWVVGGLGLVLLTGMLWVWGGSGYRQLEEKHWMRQSEKRVAKGDWRGAALCLGQILRRDPGNLEACRRMAALADQTQSAAAMDWCQRLVELAPNWTNRLRLAATAVRLEAPPCPVATQALDDLPSSAECEPMATLLRAELALKLGQYEEARRHFERVSRLQPQNLLHQVNLAVVDLHSTNAACSAAARRQLEQLSSHTNVGPIALRWLATQSLDRRDAADALRFAAQLQAQPSAHLEDRLLYLGALQLANDPEFDPVLRSIQSQARQAAVPLYAVSSWMIGHNLVDAALRWVTNCPTQVMAQPPACFALVDCLGAKRDWTKLESHLGEQRNWGAWEFLRLAFLARAAFGQDLLAAGQARWRMALREAGEQPEAQRALLNLAVAWKNACAEEELLSQIAQRFPSGRWTWPRLEQRCVSAGNTRDLNRLSHLMVTYLPGNAAAQNNFAATSLLLNQDLPKAHAIASRLYPQHKDDPFVASTYAYSLLLQGRAQDGLAALQQLPPSAAQRPDVALYFGCLHAAVGNSNAAAHWFQMADSARLLPEERALLPGPRRTPWPARGPTVPAATQAAR